ncbi:hypothetical protein B7494_g6554 [Chlorociboria aeruginascens]|nr:hypothetical protein B7494_g6554 [Chlorociboria aeruginascens]
MRINRRWTRKPNLQTSKVFLNDDITASSSRTSESASLDLEHEVVSCVLSRAGSFMSQYLPSPSSSFSPPKTLEHNIEALKHQFGTPQLVHYAHKGGRFNLHHDWYDEPQTTTRGGRPWNRAASFFVWLEDACRGGETWFPAIEAPAVGGFESDGSLRRGKEEAQELKLKWRELEDGDGDGNSGGGTVFTPRNGNALFWINLHHNGTGDWRVAHAGLEVLSGVKSAMNIWPRRYF